MKRFDRRVARATRRPRYIENENRPAIHGITRCAAHAIRTTDNLPTAGDRDDLYFPKAEESDFALSQEEIEEINASFLGTNIAPVSFLPTPPFGSSLFYQEEFRA